MLDVTHNKANSADAKSRAADFCGRYYEKENAK